MKNKTQKQKQLSLSEILEVVKKMQKKIETISKEKQSTNERLLRFQ